MKPLIMLFWMSVIALANSSACAADATTQTPSVKLDQVVFHCDFEVGHDQNYDNWPDHWLRRRGPEFPHYLEIEIGDDRSSSEPNRALQIKLDGGAATVYSPPVPISSSYSYLLRSKVRTSGLKHDYVTISLQFLDSDKLPLGKPHISEPLKQASRWTDLTVGPVASELKGARFAQIIATVQPGKHFDLTGSVWFDDMRLARVPRMDLKTNRPHNIFSDAADIELRCEVSGIDTDSPDVEFEIYDQWGNLLEQSVEQLVKDSNAQAGEFSGLAVWRPLVAKNGFYRGLVRVKSGDEILTREVSLVLTSLTMPTTRGEFGWSLDEPVHARHHRSLATLASQAGLNWLKYPVWFDPAKTEQADDVAAFAERLDLRNIQVVGVLNQPPESMKKSFGKQDHFSVASLFTDEEVWGPAIDPVISRLALKVRWWQLGTDDDQSFVGVPELPEQIERIKQRLERFGQKVQIGFGWGWEREEPNVKFQPWEFITLAETPSFTARELEDNLIYRAENSVTPRANAWVNIQPIAKSNYDAEVRARDLVLRMVAAKKAGVKGIFVHHPFHDEHGILNADESPSEMFLPWRTYAMHLAGAEYVGSIVMPGGSKNEIFARDGKAIMVIWNDLPTTERLYLGEKIRQIDLWSHETTPQLDGMRHVVETGPAPIIISDANLEVARWRMSVTVDNARLESVFGRTQTANVRFRNTFSEGVGGKVVTQAPNDWKLQNQKQMLSAAHGEEVSAPLKVSLSNGASSGPQTVQFDFTIDADRSYEFSVFRTMHVGLGDLEIRLQTYLNEEGMLIVRQEFENHSNKEVSFDCQLFAPERRRQRVQIFRQGPGVSVRTFQLPDGEELVGQELWLRAEEVRGDRILNSRVKVER